MGRSIRTWLIAAIGAAASSAAADSKAVTVLFDNVATSIDGAMVEEGELWVPAESLAKIDGFELKPMGFCSKNQCVPAPRDGGWTRDSGGQTYVAATKLAKKLDQPVVRDSERGLWAFGVVPTERESKLENGQAPDFAVPDRKGKVVHRSDFRGKKVLLLTWASWCKCSLDLPRWQKVYEDMKGQNFEIIAAAQDTAGESVAGKYYDDAKATFTTLIDADHVISALYQMVNVPTGVWIDEQGHVVRPPEVAYTKGFRLLGQKVGDDRYEPALRDWVSKGDKSEYVVAKAKLKEKLAPRSLSLREAELEFRLGAYFHEHGDKVGAREHWQAAQKLDPDNWNYHRQDWSFDQREAIANWMKKVKALNGKPYYAPIELPEK